MIEYLWCKEDFNQEEENEEYENYSEGKKEIKDEEWLEDFMSYGVLPDFEIMRELGG